MGIAEWIMLGAAVLYIMDRRNQTVTATLTTSPASTGTVHDASGGSTSSPAPGGTTGAIQGVSLKDQTLISQIGANQIYFYYGGKAYAITAADATKYFNGKPVTKVSAAQMAQIPKPETFDTALGISSPATPTPPSTPPVAKVSLKDNTLITDASNSAKTGVYFYRGGKKFPVNTPAAAAQYFGPTWGKGVVLVPTAQFNSLPVGIPFETLIKTAPPPVRVPATPPAVIRQERINRSLAACFSGNTTVKTPDYGLVRIDELHDGDRVMTPFGPRECKVVRHEPADREMRDMGMGELVTPDHEIQLEGKWVFAGVLFCMARFYRQAVYDLSIVTDKDEERCFYLGNGRVAHNKPNLPVY